MTRPDISMDAEDLDAFVARCPQWVLGVIDADGWPAGTIAVNRSGSGFVAVAFDERDPVADMLNASPHVCLVADEHESYYSIKGVIVHGVIESDRRGEAIVGVERVISFDFGKLA